MAATPTPTLSPAPRASSRDFLFVFILLGITLAAFVGVKNCGFLNYDDDIYVTQNLHVQAGLTPQSIKWAFTTGEASNYHPLTWLSLMLDAQLNSPDWSNPAALFHATNVVLHLLNTLLIFVLLRSMTGCSWRSALVAGIFAVHPLRVESVVWVSERKDVLSACLGLLAMLAYVHYCRSPHWARYALVLAFFVLSLLAKPMLVTLPFLLLLLDFWPLGRLSRMGATGSLSASALEPREPEPLMNRTTRALAGKLPPPGVAPKSPFPAASAGRLLLEKLPLLGLSLASSVATVVAQHAGGAVRSLSQTPVAARLANVPVAYVRYLRNMVWFHNLSVNYPYPAAWPPLLVSGSAVVLVGVSILVFWRRRQEPWLAVGWLWFVGMLIPVIGVVQVGLQSMADRYTYLPMVGVLIMVVWSVPQGLLQAPAARAPAMLGVAVLLAVLCRSTQRHVEYWKDGVTLATHAIEMDPDNFTAQYNLGGALFNKGDLEGAASRFALALKINPGSAVTHNNYALVLQSAGHLPEAIAEYRQALLLDPGLPDAHNNIGMILSNDHKLPEAIVEFKKAIKSRPEFPEAHYNLGSALWESNDHPGAIREYGLVLTADPAPSKSLLAKAHFNLAVAMEIAGRLPEAIAHLQEAVMLQPDTSQYRDALSQALRAYASRQRGL